VLQHGDLGRSNQDIIGLAVAAPESLLLLWAGVESKSGRLEEESTSLTSTANPGVAEGLLIIF
jgi:hypothetical protein